MFRACTALLSCLTLLLTLGHAQNTAQSILIPANGSGVMVAGNLWDSYMPANKGPYYGEAANPLVEDMVRMGNFDRQWSTPTHMWPGGYDHGNFWNKDLEMAVFDPDPNFNPATIGGKANPSYFSAGGGANFAHVSYQKTVLGASDVTRNYTKETYWLDATKRHHAVFEAAWPTTVKPLSSSTPIASGSEGIRGIVISSRLDGMWVKTIVLIRPNFFARLTASRAEIPARILAPKKMLPITPASMPKRIWNQ